MVSRKLALLLLPLTLALSKWARAMDVASYTLLVLAGALAVAVVLVLALLPALRSALVALVPVLAVVVFVPAVPK
jgi:hypothetical protein